MKILFIIFLAINFSGFLLTGYDKAMAKHRKQRIPETELFMIASIGGAAGILIGMKYFRHKTKHYSFTIGIPVLLIVNIISLVLLLQII